MKEKVNLMIGKELQILQSKLKQQSSNFDSQFCFLYGQISMANSFWKVTDMPGSEMDLEDCKRIRKYIGSLRDEVVSGIDKILETVEQFEEEM